MGELIPRFGKKGVMRITQAPAARMISHSEPERRLRRDLFRTTNALSIHHVPQIRQYQPEFFIAQVYFGKVGHPLLWPNPN